MRLVSFFRPDLIRTIGDWDLAGVAASAACALHCVIPPLSLLLLPAAGTSWLTNPALGWAFVAVATVFAVVALGAGYRRHARAETLGLGAIGIGIVAAGHGLAATEDWEMLLGLVGGATLIAAHLWNRSLIRAASRCQCSACSADSPGGDAVADAQPQGSSAVGP